MTSPEPIYVQVTDRERDVLGHFLKDGADNATLALRADVSVETIRTYMQRLRNRTGSADRTALAVALLRRHVIAIDRLGRACEF